MSSSALDSSFRRRSGLVSLRAFPWPGPRGIPLLRLGALVGEVQVDLDEGLGPGVGHVGGQLGIAGLGRDGQDVGGLHVGDLDRAFRSFFGDFLVRQTRVLGLGGKREGLGDLLGHRLGLADFHVGLDRVAAAAHGHQLPAACPGRYGRCPAP